MKHAGVGNPGGSCGLPVGWLLFDLWTTKSRTLWRISVDLSDPVINKSPWKFAAYLLDGRPDRRSCQGRRESPRNGPDANWSTGVSRRGQRICPPVKVGGPGSCKRRVHSESCPRAGLGWRSGGNGIPAWLLDGEKRPGLFEGQCRSCGRSEEGSWSVGSLSGIPTLEESRSMTKGRSEEFELASAAAARMLARTTSAGRAGAFGCWINPTAHISGSFGSLGMRGPRNGASCEVLTFARCARPFVWLQKSTSVVRSRQAPPVAAGGAHGDSARGDKPAKNGSRR